MKRLYETPVVMQILLAKEDILTASDTEAAFDNLVKDEFTPNY